MTQFLAVYTGSADGAARTALSEEVVARGMAAWGAWMNANAARIVDAGGPLGKTKQVSRDGIADIRNSLTGYVVIEAASHDEAARLFEGHPHFIIFPGHSVEIMERLPIPGA